MRRRRGRRRGTWPYSSFFIRRPTRPATSVADAFIARCIRRRKFLVSSPFSTPQRSEKEMMRDGNEKKKEH